MENKLALIEAGQYNVMEKLAKIATGSGYAGKTEVQAMFIMLKGFELGISPMQALDGITVIQNKTTVSPQLMLALINRSNELADIKIESDANRAEVTMTRKGRSPHTETFTMANASSMGLSNKDNWKKQPAVMLKWRAVSACARVVFPDVIQGMYTPEEMGAEVSEDDSGNVIIDVQHETPATISSTTTIETVTGEIVEAVEPEKKPNPFSGKPTTQQTVENAANANVGANNVTFDWFTKPVGETWKDLHPYLLEHIYGGNKIGKEKSFAHHAKLTKQWAGMTAGDVVKYLETRHDEAS